MKKFDVNLIDGSIYKALMIFAIPILVSNLFQQLYNAVDTIIVGNFLGNQSLAAIGASSVIYELLVGFAIGVGGGLSIVIARNFGKKDDVLFRKTIFLASMISVSLAIIIMLFSRVLLMPILQALNTPTEIIQEAYAYISILTLYCIAMIAYNLLAGLLRAVGNSFVPLLFLIFSSFLNIGLDLLFVTQFHMGISGAAIATVISQAASAILCMLYIYFKYHQLVPHKHHMTFDKDVFYELTTQGLSMGMMMALVTTGTVVLQSGINGLGYLYVAAHTAARRIGSFFMMPMATLAFALSTFVSQNRGANQGERIRKAVYQMNVTNVVMALISTVILFFFAKTFVVLLSGSKDPLMIETATKYLLFNAPFYAILGILFNVRQSLQALNEKLLPLISSIVELLGKVVITLFLVPIIGYWGIIICEPLVWCVMCLQLCIAFYRHPYVAAYHPKLLLKGEIK